VTNQSYYQNSYYQNSITIALFSMNFNKLKNKKGDKSFFFRLVPRGGAEGIRTLVQRRYSVRFLHA